MNRRLLPYLGAIMTIGAGFVWSLGVITVKKSEHADAWQYLIWRSVGVFVAVEVVSLIRGTGVMTPRAFRSGRRMLLGCFFLWLASIAFVYALKNTTAANTAFLAASTPLIAVVFARFVLGDRLNRPTIIALTVAFAGLSLTVISDLSAGNMLGNIAALLAAVGFAGYTVVLRTESTRDWSPILPGYAVFMVAICGVITLINGNSVVPPMLDLLLAFVHGAVFIVIGTLLFNLGARTVTAVALTIFALSEYIFAPLWGFLVADETPKQLTLIGGLLVLAAVVGKAIADSRMVVAPVAPVAPARWGPQ